MKQICKIVLGIVLVVMIIRACQMEYVCDVVDSIPYDIKERILMIIRNVPTLMFWQIFGLTKVILLWLK